MIPHKLQLKNFLSYGSEPQNIDFSPYHLICLSGKNGHGKSALLDAITWAIWGQARKISGNSKADQGLLHLGQNHMFVIIEFEVNGQYYRIRREYVQTKSKPFTSLDFGVMQENKKFASLTDKTIKATQAKIEKTIGITYDSFISSAFLRQGQSNEFSKKSPQERKDVLAEILQLQQFDDQKKIALLQAKKLHIEYTTLCNIQHRIENELAQLQNIEQDYKHTQTQLTTIINQKKKLEKNKQILLNEQKKLTEQSQTFDLLQKQFRQISNHLEQTKQQIQIIAQQWHKNHNLLQNNDNHKNLEQENKKLSLELKKLQEKLQEKLVLREEYLKIKEERTHLLTTLEKHSNEELQHLHVQLTKVQEQHAQQLRQQEQLEKQKIIITKEIKQQHIDLDITNKLLKQHEPTIQLYEQQEHNAEDIKTQYQQICTEGLLVKEQINKLKTIIEINQKKPCPLCKQALTQDGHQNILKEYETLQDQLIILKNKATALKTNLFEAQKIVQITKQQYEQSINLTSKKSEQQKALEKTNNQLKELEILYQETLKEQKNYLANIKIIEASVENAQKQYNNLIFNKDIKSFDEQLLFIEKKAKELNYDQNRHKALEQELVIMHQKMQTIENSAELATQQVAHKAELFALFKTAQKYTDHIYELKQHIQEDKNIIINQQKLFEQEQALDMQYKTLEKEQTLLLVQKGSLEQKQKKEKELYKELAKLIEQIKYVQQDMIDYQEIAKALGKDGIQALLIEQAIPEIEDEANEVLARLTNNQTQIFIESLRDLKKGGCKETLDIKISDSFGLRDYELFSGGEAFRIDFALRIGISKLLARKAGTTLQTIIIDEGFGSQDEEGLHLIMDNIHKIQDEFAKVIIVSHLSEMKENFPVQFIVEKKQSGSTISVIEQG